MRNDTNLIKYRLLAPVYDAIFNPFLAKARHKAFAALDFLPGAQILLIGVGTGLDIPLLPKDCSVTGIDLSEAMLKQAKRRADCHPNATLQKMNAECLEFGDQCFDSVVLNLILSVAENPGGVLAEAVRVLKNQGSILVFDKFMKVKQVGMGRKIINRFTSFVGTDITRRFEEISAGLPVRVLKDEASIFGGNYRIIVLRKSG